MKWKKLGIIKNDNVVYNSQYIGKDYENKHDQCISETELLYTKEVIKDYWTRILG